MTNYFATVLPGLESLLTEELTTDADGISITELRRGKVFFASAEPVGNLKRLKTADNVYEVIAQFPAGKRKSDLKQLKERVYRLNLKSFLTKDTFYVNASRAGRHAYSRFDAAQAAMDGIRARYPLKSISTCRPHAVEFRLDVEEDIARFSFRHTDSTFRFRQSERSFAAAALLPTVAHAMVRLSKPEERDIFIDPCCGSGTILKERLDYPFTYVGGGDISLETLRVAEANLAGCPAEVMHWDARRLNFSDGSIGKVVTNLPFGRQIKTGGNTPDANRDILREAARVLAEGGLAVILAENWDGILREASASRLMLTASYPLSLKGLHPVIYVFRKG